MCRHLSCTALRRRACRTGCYSGLDVRCQVGSKTYDKHNTLIVSFCTHDSWAAYAIPPSRGRLNHEIGPAGMKCISPEKRRQMDTITFLILNDEPSNAMRRDVFPEPVGPTTILKAPRLKRTLPSNCSRNCRLEGVTVPSELLPDQENVAFEKPMTSSSSGPMPAA